MTWILSIIAILVLVIAIVIWRGRPYAAMPQTEEEVREDMERLAAGSLADVNLSDAPDEPESFGRKGTWLAVKTDDAGAVVEALRLSEVKQCNWKTGIEWGYAGVVEAPPIPVFVTPAVDGWMCVLGSGLPTLDGEGMTEKCLKLLCGLSEGFGEAQLFSTDRRVDFHAWACAEDGEVVRTFANAGGDTTIDRGEMTAVEDGYSFMDGSEDDEADDDAAADEGVEEYLDEDTVMEIAESWSVNPQEFAGRDHLPGLGLAGLFGTSGNENGG